MNRPARLLLVWAGIALAAVAGGLAFASARMLPTDSELVERIRAHAEARLGVEVDIGAAHLRLWPRPELVIEDAGTGQQQAIRIKRLVAQPALWPLLQGRLELADVAIDGAVLPQRSLGALRMRPAPQGRDGNAVQVAQVRFRDAIWVTRDGTALEFEGQASFDPGWQLRDAQVLRPGVRPAARIALAAEGPGQWKVDVEVGGGTASGRVVLAAGQNGASELSGELAPRNIDLASALGSFKGRSAVHGKASGTTQLSASGTNIGDIARSLQTRTTFTIASASLPHFDVHKAVLSSGKDGAGRTVLQSLSGQMETQNTPDGMVVRYSGIQATGEAFSARGQGTVAGRRIEGELSVDIAGGSAGVPLKLSGLLSQPEVTVPRTAVATSR